jgi:GAF domain-containing protein
LTQSAWQQIYREFRPPVRNWRRCSVGNNAWAYSILNTEPGYFSEDQCEIIEALANQAAIAIQNAQRDE